MIEFEGVSKKYDDELLTLSDIHFKIEPGEFVVFVGHSGAGKTTLTKLLLREEKPTNGKISFESVDLGELSSKDLTAYRQRVGTIFQDFRLLPNKTAYENIAFAMQSLGKDDDEILRDVPNVLGLVDLAERMHHFPHQMSGGEKQRLAIARAIINQPEVIIADEPIASLDPINSEDVLQMLKKINDLGTTVILTTHDRDVGEKIGKRIIMIEKGKIIKDTKVKKTKA
ncbi:MAG: cell division ATP-binding protein FtsE [Candidatus Yanofskybacteria bacterium RIFCSPLOWO2_01_FULL_41_34]|nr:MAG: cell division ATP-binding protein FtsE [Candidatus Yanofskybacteria bacterium RIFCSPLOWO2_01_FULL_41_34]